MRLLYTRVRVMCRLLNQLDVANILCKREDPDLFTNIFRFEYISMHVKRKLNGSMAAHHTAGKRTDEDSFRPAIQLTMTNYFFPVR